MTEERIKNKFWVNGFFNGFEKDEITNEDRAVIKGLQGINTGASDGDVKTDCEYELRRAYRWGAADAKSVTDDEIDELLRSVNEVACDEDYTTLGLPVYSSDPLVINKYRQPVRSWLAALHQ